MRFDANNPPNNLHVLEGVVKGFSLISTGATAPTVSQAGLGITAVRDDVGLWALDCSAFAGPGMDGMVFSVTTQTPDIIPLVTYGGFNGDPKLYVMIFDPAGGAPADPPAGAKFSILFFPIFRNSSKVLID